MCRKTKQGVIRIAFHSRNLGEGKLRFDALLFQCADGSPSHYCKYAELI